VYTDTFNGYGAGVAYYQGVAYATDYSGKLYAYEAVGGTWQRTAAIPNGVATLIGASRPAVIGDHLYVHQYDTNKFQIFSLATPGSPTPVGTLIADKNISTYARLVQSGNHLYLALQEPNAAGETVIAYNVSDAGNPVRDQRITAALAAVLFRDEQIPWPQKGVLGMTVMADSAYLSVISSAASDGAIRMITILKDPN
jgi:outer membrane protein assembly factor BamB